MGRQGLWHPQGTAWRLHCRVSPQRPGIPGKWKEGSRIARASARARVAWGLGGSRRNAPAPLGNGRRGHALRGCLPIGYILNHLISHNHGTPMQGMGVHYNIVRIGGFRFGRFLVHWRQGNRSSRLGTQRRVVFESLQTVVSRVPLAPLSATKLPRALRTRPGMARPGRAGLVASSRNGVAPALRALQPAKAALLWRCATSLTG